VSSGSLIGLCAAVGAALVGGALARRERRSAQQASTDCLAAEQRAESLRADLDRLRRELDLREADLARRRQLLELLQRARQAEREWNQELRSQLHAAHEARGALAEAQDVRELVLRTAIELVGAEKGLLLSRQDLDRDGDLDLVTAHGFEHDPTHSAVAQRFAQEVLDRDRIVRVDAPTREEHADTPADTEIESLVAIPLYLMDRFQGVVVCANRRGGFEELDDELLLALGDHAGTALHTDRLENEIHEGHRAALRMLAEALEASDPLRRREAAGAVMLARILCRRLELEPAEEELVASATLVRDVGHIGISERVVHKPGPLSPEERSLVELHPRIGFNLLNHVAALRGVGLAVLYHHERFDGAGYPAGLAADAIPRSARVLAIVDAYSAMIHDRPYRPRRSSKEALEALTEGAGSQFDPEIAQLFIEDVQRAGEPLQAGLAEAVAMTGLAVSREDVPTSDPLTLLAGHREFCEAAQAAARAAGGDGPPFSVALIQIESLDEVNRREGYAAGDRIIQTAARSAQHAALRFGGTVYRHSGRRLGVFVPSRGAPGEPDLAAELHNHFALGPSIRLAVATWQPGDTGDDVIRRARAGLTTHVMPP
jgi:HD-GYP domain-containing protein (c-di-GMP phosphodiesterase class II)